MIDDVARQSWSNLYTLTAIVVQVGTARFIGVEDPAISIPD
jgi:hypothetical protein